MRNSFTLNGNYILNTTTLPSRYVVFILLNRIKSTVVLVRWSDYRLHEKQVHVDRISTAQLLIDTKRVPSRVQPFCCMPSGLERDKKLVTNEKVGMNLE